MPTRQNLSFLHCGSPLCEYFWRTLKSVNKLFLSYEVKCVESLLWMQVLKENFLCMSMICRVISHWRFKTFVLGQPFSQIWWGAPHLFSLLRSMHSGLKNAMRVQQIFKTFFGYSCFPQIFLDFLGFSRIFPDFPGFSRIFRIFLKSLD